MNHERSVSKCLPCFSLIYSCSTPSAVASSMRISSHKKDPMSQAPLPVPTPSETNISTFSKCCSSSNSWAEEARAKESIIFISLHDLRCWQERSWQAVEINKDTILPAICNDPATQGCWWLWPWGVLLEPSKGDYQSYHPTLSYSAWPLHTSEKDPKRRSVVDRYKIN